MLAFEEARPKLFAVAYRMLGSAMDAEDIVQDVYLRYQQLESPPDNELAYLRKVVTNLCIDHLKSAKVQREQYIGEWLPEPIKSEKLSPAEQVSKAESISMAFLVMLETLSPLERAVFLLREVFDYKYAEIASMLDKSESACRQLFSRAQKHIQNNRPRFEAKPEDHERLVTNFVAALQQGNISQLTQLLAQDVTLYSDGGGKAVAALRPLHGAEKIVAFLMGLVKRAADANIAYTIEQCSLNGQQGIILRTSADDIILAATFDVHQGQIVTLRFVRNPDKLQAL